ncbi:MAG: peroxiredoxin [Candidatus Aenigmarchaeota archaeon]|nr:peroxiredoxin [Candidatus Aenigmarchaeota archaeon]
MLKEGEDVNPLEAFDQEGKLQKLDFKGTTIVYFYPRDNTPGCTREACGFRNDIEQFKKLGVKVFGVSTDSVESHKKFVEKYKLNFPLLSDKEKKICKAFGVPALIAAKRVTFVVKNGKVVYVDSDVKADGHSTDLLGGLKVL